MAVGLSFCLIFIVSLTARASTTNSSHVKYAIDEVLSPQRVHEKGILTPDGTLPDWSGVRNRYPRYVEMLLAVDSAVARYYGHEPERIRTAMLMLMHAVNMYAFQLDIRIIVVDVVAVHGHNFTLEKFLEWKLSTPNLVAHDVAVLIRYRYEGGIAYVNGVCKRTAVGIAGFFPEAPHEYASVLFHELSHLLGLSHTARVECYCSKKDRGNCLRINGFDNECSAQALVDLLSSIECLEQPRELPRSGLALCGNGVVEEYEDCDCGPARFCNNALCEPRTCRFVIARQYLYSMFTFGPALAICVILVLLRKFPLPNKRVLHRSDSPPTELAPYLRANNNAHCSSIKSSFVNTSMSAIGCKPVRPAPKRPLVLALDSPVPVSKELALPSDYVPMHPPKVLRMTSLESESDELSDSIALPIPKTRGEYAARKLCTPVQVKVSQNFIAALEDALRLHTPKRSPTLLFESTPQIPPRPSIPDRTEKMSLFSSTDTTDMRIYDSPA